MMPLAALATLACMAQAASITSDAACQAGEASCSQTSGAALLQLSGAVGKRVPVEGEESKAAGSAASKEKRDIISELQKKSAEKNAADKKPKDFDFMASSEGNNNDLTTGNDNNVGNLNMNNNLDTSNLNTNVDETKLAMNNNDAFEFNNNNEDKPKKVSDSTKDGFGGGKKGGNKKKDDVFDFGGNNNDAEKGATKDVGVDNFDFGDGPVKTEAQKSHAATEAVKKNVNEAVGKISSVLKDAETSEKAVHDALDKINVAGNKEMEKLKEAVEERITEALDKVKEAQKELKDLQKEVKPSAAHLGLPRVWLLAATCLWWFLHI